MNQTIKKLEDMSLWSIGDYDAAGAHISEHLISKEALREQAIEEVKRTKVSSGKVFSAFCDSQSAEAIIHEAILNPLNKKRIKAWIESKDYEQQNKIIISYPANQIIGYSYVVEGENIKYEECEYICLVFLKAKKTEDFLLYTAYPERTKILTVL